MTKRKAMVAVGTVALIAGAGMAIAAFLLRADINGSGNVVGAPTIQFVSSGTEVLPTTNLAAGTCTVSVDGAGVATVTMTDIIQGEACDLQLMVDRNGGGSSVVRAQNVDWSDVTDDRFINASGGATLDAATNTPVHVRFLVPASAPLGNFTALLTGSDLVAVNAGSFNPATCPTF